MRIISKFVFQKEMSGSKMNRYQYRLTPKAGELGLAPTNNNISRSNTEKREKSHHQNHQNHQNQQGSALRKPQKEREPEQPCSCNRAKQLVLCQRCGGTFQGRVKRDCAKHPKAIFLLDVSCCPRPQCKAGLEALKEFPNPTIAQQQQQERPRQRVNSVKKRKCDTPENSEMEMGDTD